MMTGVKTEYPRKASTSGIKDIRTALFGTGTGGDHASVHAGNASPFMPVAHAVSSYMPHYSYTRRMRKTSQGVLPRAVAMAERLIDAENQRTVVNTVMCWFWPTCCRVVNWQCQTT